jgi:hypothetical protein
LAQIYGYLKNCMGNNIDRRTATRYAIRRGLSASKYVRKTSWRLLQNWR